MYNRNEILKCLGDFPKRVNLDITELISEDMGDYERKLIEYTLEYRTMILLKKYKLMY